MKKIVFVIIGLLLSLFAKPDNYAIVNGLRYILDNSSKTACVVSLGSEVNYSGDIVIPESFMYEGESYIVNKINEYISPYDIRYKDKEYHDDSFANSQITSVVIPKTVEEIGALAFSRCTELKKVTFLGSKLKIGYNAFDECDNLESVYITDLSAWCNLFTSKTLARLESTQEPSIRTSPLYYAKHLFLNKEEITDLVIPDDVNIIPESAFYGCTNFTSISIPENVTIVDGSCFSRNVNVLDYYCYREDQLLGISNNDIDIVIDRPEMTIHVPDYIIETLKNYSNYHHDWDILKLNVKNILPIEIVTDFKLTYFVNGEVYKTETHKYDDEIIPEIIKKKGMTFSGWDITIPEKMPGKDIEAKGTLSWSKNTVDNVIYEVSDTTNNYCKVIGNESASGAIKIAEAVDFDFSYNVTTITDNTFNGCKDITSIDIPATVTTIGERTFASIDKLTDVTIYAEDVPETDRTAFENSYIEDYVTLHVPAASIDKYKEVAPWKNFKSIVSIEGTEPPQIFKLIYMVDGEVYKTVEIEEGAEITPEAEPTKDGYVFSGWSEIPDVMPSEDVTITGTFTEDTSDGDDDDVVNPEEGDTDETNVGEEVIPISGAKQTTWCSEYDLDFTDVEGVKAYIASGYDRETGIIWLTRVNKVPAGEGILIIADKGDYTIPHVSTSAYYANLMVGTLNAMVLNETDGEYTNYYLSNGTSGVGFYKVNGSVDIKANRAYLPLLKGTTKANTRFIGIGFEGEDGTTGIRNISSEENAVWYNLQGQRVDNPAKGIYIRNGKKVIVR